MTRINFQELKNQQTNAYMQEYFNSKLPLYTPISGGFNWDAANNEGSYNERNNALPPLNEMWQDFAKGARSRGVKADYVTFKKYYDSLKQTQNTQFLKHLSNAEAGGMPLDKIHEVLRENPHLRNKLINATADGGENSTIFRERYNPAAHQTWGQFMEDNPWLIPAGIIGATAGSEFLFGKPGMDEYNKKIKESDRIKNKAEEKYKKYVDKNHPRDKTGKKIPKTKVINGKRVTNPEYAKFTNSKGYKTQTTQYKNNLTKAKDMVDNLDKPQSRYSKWKGKTGGRYSTTAQVAGGFAPQLVEWGAEDLLGFDPEDARFAGDVTGVGVGGAFLTSGIKDIMSGKVKSGLVKSLIGVVQGGGSGYSLFGGGDEGANVAPDQSFIGKPEVIH